MPELPEVEIFKNYFDNHALNKTIREVVIKNESLLETSATAFRKAFVGRKFTSTARVGKYLLAKTDRKDWLSLHFGMTGSLSAYPNSEEAPNYSQVIFQFSGLNLSVISKRKLGRIGVTSGVNDLMEEKELGPDALSLNKGKFVELLAKRKGALKSAFMDQRFIAGLGNIYSDEILYQSALHPKRRIADLSNKEVEALYDVMQKTLKTCIRKKADPRNFPQDFLTLNRRDKADCPKCGGKIKKITIGGRGTYICPACQKV